MQTSSALTGSGYSGNQEYRKDVEHLSVIPYPSKEGRLGSGRLHTFNFRRENSVKGL